MADKKYNEDWNVVNIIEWGKEVPCVHNDYTMLCNRKTGQLVVAYKYNEKDNSWAQGHYFNGDSFYPALEFMHRDTIKKALES